MCWGTTRMVKKERIFKKRVFAKISKTSRDPERGERRSIQEKKGNTVIQKGTGQSEGEKGEGGD